jgi:hypothetical protein
MEVIWQPFIFERCVAHLRLAADEVAWRAVWAGLTVAKVRLACDGGGGEPLRAG